MNSELTHALNLAGLTILHRTLLSAHIERAGLITAAPWFRDSWVSIDDLESLDDPARVKLLALLDRFATEYAGTSVGREFAHVRDEFDQIMHTLDDRPELLAYGDVS